MRSPALRVARLFAVTLALISCTPERATGPDGFSQTGAEAANHLLPNLVITEIMADPSKVADNLGEWFEVFNAGTESVALAGYRFNSGTT